MDESSQPHRIVILGGGFGGVYTTLHLDKCLKHVKHLEVTIISRENYYVMTPFLFEASSGMLEPRHAVIPIRRLFKNAHLVTGEIERVDFERKIVYARHSAEEELYRIPYNDLVVALGGITNTALVKGAENALPFKSLADAIYLRNHVIDQFERAVNESDPARREQMLTFVVVGGGLVGVELIAELTEFLQNLCRYYRRISPEQLRCYLLESGKEILSEMRRDQADYAERMLRKEGIQVRTDSRVAEILPGMIRLVDGSAFNTNTVLLAVGIAPNPLLRDFPLQKDKWGRIIVDGTLRSVDRTDIWALGDCAAVPNPLGGTYPALAQHALRQAKVLADNIVAVHRERKLKVFTYRAMGMLATLGNFRGVGRIRGIRLRGFPAWWTWRTYYLMRMPGIDRKLRIMLDWTIGLFFRYDIVRLDLYGRQHPLRNNRDKQAVEKIEEMAAAGSGKKDGA